MSHKSLEPNKFAGAILMAGIIAMIAGFAADGLYTPKEAEKRGFSVEVAEETAAGDATAAEVEVDIATLLATADAAAGEATAKKKCTSCHTFEAGGANKVGPALHGVAGSKIGTHAAGFAYSDALKSHSGNWGDQELNQWLKAPAKFAKGNKMAYAGLKDDKERANVIAYLKSLK